MGYREEGRRRTGGTRETALRPILFRAAVLALAAGVAVWFAAGRDTRAIAIAMIAGGGLGSVVSAYAAAFSSGRRR